MKTIIYCRVSSKEQSKYSNGHVSLEMQEKIAKDWCTKNNYGNVQVIKEVKSASKSYKQTLLNKVIDEVDEGDVIVFYNITRFSRNVKDALIMVDELSDKKVQIYSVLENCGYNNIAQKHLFRTTLCFAQHESDQISERVKQSIEYRRSRGDYIGNPAFGFKAIKNEDGIRVLEEHPGEQQIIKNIAKMVEKGASLQEISDILNADRNKNRGKDWTPQLVKRVMFRNNIRIPTNPKRICARDRHRQTKEPTHREPRIRDTSRYYLRQLSCTPNYRY